MFVLLASSDYDNSVASDDHSTLSRLPHSSTLSCRPGWITAIQFSPGRRNSLQTGCNECWTLPCALSVTRRNSTAVCRDSMHTKLHWLDVPERVQYKLGVLMYRCQHTKLLGIWPTTAHQYLTLFCASACVQPAVIKSPSHATRSARTAVGLFLLLVRRSETHCLKTCRIWSVPRTVTDSHWRHFYFCSTSVFSTSEVCCENTLYKFTFDIDTDIITVATIISILNPR